jgi:hypothetical protein
MPLTYIYLQQRMAKLAEKAGPLGAICSYYKSGWAMEELFAVLLRHFM